LILYHITSRSAWIDATRQGVYTTPSLATEGFIHCSTASQVLPVARQFYAGQKGLVLLAIDTARLTSGVQWEGADGGAPAGVTSNSLFPHVYGSINLEAVTQVWDFEPDAQGRFPTPFLEARAADGQRS
jgi:uncharacterized protein (DUF952 family)